MDSVTSTQDVARDLAVGDAVIANNQTAGRGRLNHRWDAPPGTALLASFVLEPNPLLSLALGVAAAEACGAGVRLKWPNDLLMNGRKVGGILVEVAPSKAIAGIGINLTWSPEGAAKLLQPRDELFSRLQEAIGKWTAASPHDVLARWRELSDTLGRRVKVELPDRVIEGVATDIDEHGALLVDGFLVAAGDVIHLRDSEEPA